TVYCRSIEIKGASIRRALQQDSASKKQAELIAEKERERLQAEKQLVEEALLHKETEQQLLEERSQQLVKADQLKTEFLANM
ncbi:hypothetical protein, partial [Gordonia paraffinivorans]|uniref:hypothetical protein n=1 Tax=Gordonia paraffinivorans TaxID=175628 RepID=UPI001444EE89